ncbi:Glyoxalase/bleomycin resistance protein/dioxygenase [Beutenbergia cavernae DSM 12333]|uniref:Glyoxalase/bleomycin resistance protein/dioxygenase n=1 Tax=Beutenbergia cavernae (strain ATCC BAA-8 / DSM 12333 / CCUG 43141 / JCM 11478 / NBRC 16432 / NCIMB 13614 / HKI 0122) TaxID=471853 RepID=C5BV08_BEUC1|nr:VOC family protein [Beutenbergia cavernae]ACQ78382.1 Glyoxalase/bleomycin resistance protein/dioxygenase [Beutenbergia cavernae DSM 12333]
MTTEASSDAVPYRPAGYSTITPFLCVDGAAAAVAFYTDVFGAHEIARAAAPDGTIAHAELQVGDGRLQLGDPNPAYGIVAPSGDDAVTFSLAIYVPDCDAVTEAAARAGATVREQPSTFVTGDRFASIRDPFGIRWSIMTRVEDVSDEEADRRVREWMAAQG